MFKKKFGDEFLEAKECIFSVFSQINSQLYSQKSVHLLHSVCEVIASNTNTLGIPKYFYAQFLTDSALLDLPNAFEEQG